MSETKFFKDKRKKSANVEVKSEPRSREEIVKEYTEVQAKLGGAQYLKYVYERETEILGQQMLSLNQEADARQKLDAEAKAKETPDVKS